MAGRKRKAVWTTEELMKVVEMYHLQNKSQAEIGRAFKRTRQDIGRILADAREQGVVQILIAAPVGHEDLRQLSEKLKSCYPCLNEVQVVAGHPTILDENPIPSIREGIALSIAQAGARLVERLLRDDDVVVMGRGHMVKSLVNSFHLSKSLPHLRIVPMQGVIRRQHDPLDANVIAADLQRVTGGSYAWLPIPAIVKVEQRQTVCSLPIVKDTLKLMQQATVVITSIGPLTEDKLRIFIDLGFPLREMQALRRKLSHDLPVGEIGGWFFHADGRPLEATDLTWYPIGFELNGMRNIVKDKKGRVICVAGADKNRFDAIHGALCGGVTNTLITDHITAQNLLSRFPSDMA